MCRWLLQCNPPPYPPLSDASHSPPWSSFLAVSAGCLVWVARSGLYFAVVYCMPCSSSLASLFLSLVVLSSFGQKRHLAPQHTTEACFYARTNHLRTRNTHQQENVGAFPGMTSLVSQLNELCTLKHLGVRDPRPAIQRIVLISAHEVPRRLLKTVAAICVSQHTMAAMYRHTGAFFTCVVCSSSFVGCHRLKWPPCTAIRGRFSCCES